MSETSDTRDLVLRRVRQALGARGDEPGRHSAVRARLERSAPGLRPERARMPKDELPDLLVTMLKAQGAYVHVVDRLADVPRAIAEQLAEFNLPASLRHGEDPLLGRLNWDETTIEREIGPGDGSDSAALSRAVTGAAETGTLVLTSGADNPSTLNFLPDTHLVVVLADSVVGSYEEAWDRLRAVYGHGTLPRTVNFISGPSATADIEQTLIRGAHGPRRLAVFVVLDEDETASN